MASRAAFGRGSRSALAYALPYIRDEMRISDEMTGYVSSAAFLGQMIGSLVGSYLGDIFGRRPVIIWCTILSALLTALFIGLTLQTLARESGADVPEGLTKADASKLIDELKARAPICVRYPSVSADTPFPPRAGRDTPSTIDF